MRREPGQAHLDAAIVEASVEARVAWVTSKRAMAMRIVWQQLDAAGISDPIEQARFLLGRLYPDMPPAWREGTLAALTERHAHGRWQGYPRPS
jgi:hypothetical protein